MQQFVSFWHTENPLSFKTMPPNAVLTYADKVDGKNVQAMHLVRLNSARITGSEIVFTVEFSHHMKPPSGDISNVSLFID